MLMKRKIKNIIFSFLFMGIFVSITVFAFWRSPITKYKPKNDAERAIANLFIDYITARNNRDVDQFIATLHNDCTYMITKDLVVSKQELKGMLPAFWMQNDDDTMAFGHCMAWECWNENYYETGMLINPKFNIAENHADVEFQFNSGLFRDDNYFHLIKENNNWLILSFSRPMY